MTPPNQSVNTLGHGHGHFTSLDTIQFNVGESSNLKHVLTPGLWERLRPRTVTQINMYQRLTTVPIAFCYFTTCTLVAIVSSYFHSVVGHFFGTAYNSRKYSSQECPKHTQKRRYKRLKTLRKWQIFHEVPSFPRECPKCPEYSGILEVPKMVRPYYVDLPVATMLDSEHGPDHHVAQIMRGAAAFNLSRSETIAAYIDLGRV